MLPLAPHPRKAQLPHSQALGTALSSAAKVRPLNSSGKRPSFRKHGNGEKVTPGYLQGDRRHEGYLWVFFPRTFTPIPEVDPTMLLCYKEGEWSSERVGHLSEDTQLTSGRVWTPLRVCVTSLLVSEAAASMWMERGWEE